MYCFVSKSLTQVFVCETFIAHIPCWSYTVVLELGVFKNGSNATCLFGWDKFTNDDNILLVSITESVD